MQRRRRSGRKRRRRANRTFKMHWVFESLGGRTPPCRDRCGCAFAAQRKPAAPALALLRHWSRFSRPVLGGRHPSFARSLRFLRRTAGARQTGQMEDRVSHRRMHSRWNTWAQRRTTTPAPSSPPSSSSQTTAQRQTAHEAALAAALRQLGCKHRSFRSCLLLKPFCFEKVCRIVRWVARSHILRILASASRLASPSCSGATAATVRGGVKGGGSAAAAGSGDCRRRRCVLARRLRGLGSSCRRTSSSCAAAAASSSSSSPTRGPAAGSVASTACSRRRGLEAGIGPWR